MSATNTDLLQRDHRALLHSLHNPAAHLAGNVWVRGEGCELIDADGKRYIDAMSGLWNVTLGHGRRELADAAARQMRALPYYHSFSGKVPGPVTELVETMIRWAPVPMARVLFANSGSESNDTAFKLVRYYHNAIGKPAKKKIIGRDKGYHGVTAAAASMSGLPVMHKHFDLPLPGIVRVGCPHPYQFAHAGETPEAFASRMAAELEATILREGPDTIAAFIGEPLMGAGGVLVPPAGYWEKVNAILARYDVRFIADEVICGFGRTGNWFGSTTMGMKPHSISMAKAITSAYFPLSALTIEEDLYQAMLDESRMLGTFGHGYTYTAHPVGCATALKTIEIYQRDKIIEHAAKVSPVFQMRLRKLGEHPMVGEARGTGLIGAVELVADKATKRPFAPKRMAGATAVNMMQDLGLIVRNIQDSLALCPPLIITTDEIHEMFDIFEKGLDQMEAWARRENAREG